MELIFTAVFLVLILVRIFISAYAGPGERRSYLARGLSIGLALLFIVFVYLVVQQAIQIVNA